MSKSYNPFDEDEDEDFKPVSWNEDPAERRRREEMDGKRSLQQEVMWRAQNTVDSSNKSLSLIYESEKVGVETAEELMRQGEALKRTEKMVDKMEQDMKTSQRHINSIKSMFSGFTNYFKAKPAETPPQNGAYDYKASNKLEEAMTSSKVHEDRYEATHPNLLKRDTLDNSSNVGAAGSGYPSKNRVLQEYHMKVDNNLDEMSVGLGRLKNLAMGLQSEIDEQDDIIDRLGGKVDKMDLNIKTTDKRIREEL
ncbi:PREDICTED: synaptosomal-associated protein 29 [Nanorana parkeri]|uniref:synaptosomal-associated protein 29 n=1 Tax=Nanorana parkeri TaxID=125878 RepID=UPI0008547142|nr:PREDICTED: synaptosomal-associated protein 29 [Nanorana parkeri]